MFHSLSSWTPERSFKRRLPHKRPKLLRRIQFEDLEQRTVLSTVIESPIAEVGFIGPFSLFATDDTSAKPQAALVADSARDSGLAKEQRVTTRDELIAALRSAQPGAVITVAPGMYGGGIFAANVQGTAAAPIVVRAEDPANRPVISGGGEGIHLSDVAYLELRDLVVERATSNGINIDDGGSYATPSHHLLLDGILVRDIGTSGNQDGIKLSGVDDFELRNSEILRWGAAGSGIDMVGCHRGLVEGNLFQHSDTSGNNGVMAKGGSDTISVRGNRFEHAGRRALQIGGSTGLEYFRPDASSGWEARNVLVEQNVIVGSEAAVAFVNSDSVTVRYNTIYQPTRWIFRILKEDKLAGMHDTRDGLIVRNIIAWNGSVSTHVNIGTGTQPETFQFSENWWWNSSNPSSSIPALPASEQNGIYGIDPEFVNPATGDFHLLPGSPAEQYGAYVVAGVMVSPKSGLSTTESGGAATFTVVLACQPMSDVSLDLSSSDPTEGVISASRLTFTAANWNQPQTVIVTGIDDTQLDGDVAYTIVTAAAQSADSRYEGLNPADVALINADNDVAQEPIARFDFGTSTSPLAAGYTRVTSQSKYSRASGFGWLTGAIKQRQRDAPDDIRRDYNYVSSGAMSFGIDVPVGAYWVTMIVGDSRAAWSGIEVFLEGRHEDTLSPVAGEFLTKTYLVNVSDGQLTLTMPNGGLINGLTIEKASGAE